MPKKDVGVTPWFLYGVRPVRPGVYQRRSKVAHGYSRWEAGVWYWTRETPEAAAAETRPSLSQTLQWRGLAGGPACD